MAYDPGPEWTYLGTETDQCGGSLQVKNRNNRWVSVKRGVPREVEVSPTGDGKWYWKCGSVLEWSRGGENFRQRVRMLVVEHSTEGREIKWRCYDRT